MNVNDYRNTLSYPDKEDFVTRIQHITNCGEEIELLLDRDAYNKAKTEYQKESRRLQQKFEDDLKEHLGIVDNPKANLLLERAWFLGHAGGYEEIIAYAEDLVDLIL